MGHTHFFINVHRGREFHFTGQIARQLHRIGRHRQHLIRAHAQLGLHMNRTGSDEGMNAIALGRPHRFGGALDILLARSRQAGDCRSLYFFGDAVDRLKISRRSDGKTGLDDIDAKTRQGMGHTHFFINVHRAAGRLLPVSQGGIENIESIRHGFFLLHSKP